MFIDIGVVLAFNCFMTYIIGMRIGGKTYGALKYGLNKYRKSGKQFMYVKRRYVEFNDDGDWKVLSLFDPLIENEEFKGWTYEIDKNGRFYMYKTKWKESKAFNKDEHVCGYYVALSSQRNQRSVAYPKCDTIIYDEFILDTQAVQSGYLKKEAHQFQELQNTVFRRRKGCRCILIANSISVVNPFFTAFNIKPVKGQEFTRFNFNGATHVIQQHVHENIMNEILDTPQGKLWASNTYGDYAIGNQYLRDTDDFIIEKESTAKPLFNVLYEGRNIGFWLAKDTTRLFSSFKYDETKPLYTLTTADHNENTLLIKSIKKTHYLPVLVNAFEIGALYFDNQEVKKTVYDLLDLIR